MTTALTRCPQCKRHIYRTEATCPFCAKTSFAGPAALVVALAATSGVLVGCGGPTPEPQTAEPAKPADPQPPPAPTTTRSQPDVPITPPASAYGGPPPTEPLLPPKR